jgi:hypothetical protein
MACKHRLRRSLVATAADPNEVLIAAPPKRHVCLLPLQPLTHQVPQYLSLRHRPGERLESGTGVLLVLGGQLDRGSPGDDRVPGCVLAGFVSPLPPPLGTTPLRVCIVPLVPLAAPLVAVPVPVPSSACHWIVIVASTSPLW